MSGRQMEMIIGVSTRKYKRSLETETDAYRVHGDSKSTVSRNFITMTAAKLDEWLKKPITEKYPAASRSLREGLEETLML